MATKVTMPKIGLNMKTGLLVEWLAGDKQQVNKGQPIFSVETDKVVNEVTAEKSGIIFQAVVEGSEVPVAGLVGWILEHGEDIPDQDKEIESKQSVLESKKTDESTKMLRTDGKILATPAAKRRANELGIKISEVAEGFQGEKVDTEEVERFVRRQEIHQERSGEAEPASKEIRATPVARRMAQEYGIDLGMLALRVGGRSISKDDVEETIAAREKSTEEAEAKYGVRAKEEEKGLKGTRGLIAERLHASSTQTAPVTLFMEVDATNLVNLRKVVNQEAERSGKTIITYNDLLVLMTAKALQEYPYMNTSLVDGRIEQKEEINIGVAVDTERGLLVPVVREADKKKLAEINAILRGLVENAVAGKSSLDDLSGGTFTVTNLGMYHIDAFTPIINLPETAILGVGRIVEKPVGFQGQIMLRQQLILSLTFDHRLVDGAPAARFLHRLGQLIEEAYPSLVF
jgi:pyruvate dehydrogenase E2 component (dihydrolipoamide acetyltransferase)